jgi:hypothetical protein
LCWAWGWCCLYVLVKFAFFFAAPYSTGGARSTRPTRSYERDQDVGCGVVLLWSRCASTASASRSGDGSFHNPVCPIKLMSYAIQERPGCAGPELILMTCNAISG